MGERPWEYLFTVGTDGGIQIDVTVEAGSLDEAIKEANSELGAMCAALEDIEARIVITVDDVEVAHLRQVDCRECGSEVVRQDGQDAQNLLAILVTLCECEPTAAVRIGER